MGKIVTKGERVREATTVIAIAVAGAVLIIAIWLALLPSALWRRIPLHHSPQSKVRLQGSGTEQRSRTELENSSITHRRV
jgi:hypothetical protein